MARGDATYGNTNVDWPLDPRCLALKSDSSRWLNHVLWLTAVKERREVLPLRYNYGYFAAILGKKSANVQKWVAEQCTQGLIEIMPDGAIKVCGIKDCHRKLKWKDSPYGDDTGGVSQGRRKRVEKESRERELDELISPPVNSDIPNQNKDLIDPSPQYQQFAPLEGSTKTLAEICDNLQKYSENEIYTSNWTHFAHVINSGLDINTLKKAVTNHIKQHAGTKFKRGFKKSHPNEQSIKATAEKAVTAPKSSDSGISNVMSEVQKTRERIEKRNAERGN